MKDRKIKEFWRISVQNKNNGDFKDRNVFIDWCYEKGYNEITKKIRKKNIKELHSKDNTIVVSIYKKIKREQSIKDKNNIKLNMYWNKCIKNKQDNSFKNKQDFINWSYENGYITNICSVRKKDYKKLHSKENTEFVIKIVINDIKYITNVKTLYKYNIRYYSNDNIFYAYLKYNKITKVISKSDDLKTILMDYFELYKYLFGKIPNIDKNFKHKIKSIKKINNTRYKLKNIEI